MNSINYDIHAVLMGADKQGRESTLGVVAQGAADNRIVILKTDACSVSFRLNDLLEGLRLSKGSEGEKILAARVKKLMDEQDAQAEALVANRRFEALFNYN